VTNSKKKGNRWELDVAHLFTENFEGEFRRVPQSGAFFGGANRKRAEGVRADAQEILSGDIITPENFEFSIECKSYKDLEFHQMYLGKCASLDRWIEQGEEDASFSKKKMLLIIKISRKGTFVCVDESIVNKSNFENYMVYKNKYIIVDLMLFVEWRKNILKI
jgi:hypothetical protein